MVLAKDHKTIRFSCLTKAYQEALDGFDLLACMDFSSIKKETEGLDRYKKLNWLAKHSIKIFKENTDEKFWAVYISLLEDARKQYGDCFAGARNDSNGFSYKSKFENDHVNYAIRNAFFAYFALVNLIPKLYKRQFGREIEPALYRKTVMNTLPFLYKLSKFHFDVFRAFLYATTQKDHGVNPELHVLKLDLFKFEVSEDGSLNLDLSKRAYLKIKEEAEKIAKKGKLRIEEPTIGCPALQVYDSQGQDLIKTCFYWVTETLDQLEFYDSALAPYSSSH